MKQPLTPLRRRFREKGDGYNPEIDYLELMGLGPSGLTWRDLLQLSCVVVLGEGRSGKTYEFRQQHQRRKDSNQFSFYIALEKLHDHTIKEALDETEWDNFQLWRKNSVEIATFFLDAVDELKLRNGSLRKAVIKVKEAIGHDYHGGRFYISCRPGDWADDDECSELDERTVWALLPKFEISKPLNKPQEREALFLSVVCPNALSDDKEESPRLVSQESSTSYRQFLAGDGQVKVVTLAPLSQKEADSFAREYSQQSAQSFLRYVNKNDLWPLYRYPTDITQGVDLVESAGDQEILKDPMLLFEFGVCRRLTEENAKQRNALAREAIREGVETLALALCLANHRTIIFGSSQGHTSYSGVLAADLLTNLHRDGHEELLHRPIFVSTTIGHFEFHHRTTQEYLSACRLLKLLKAGLSRRDLHSYLFADVGAEQILIPSMEQVTAWLAIMDDGIFHVVMQRKPQLLLEQGFPTRLDIPKRIQLIKSFVAKNSIGYSRGLNVAWSNAERLAAPELDSVIENEWEIAYKGVESRELLLKIMYETRMPSCELLAYAAALDETLPELQRVLAAGATFRHASIETRRKLAAAALNGTLDQSVFIRVMNHVFPSTLGVDQFVTLLCSIDDKGIEAFGVSLFASSIADSKRVNQEDLVELRNKITSVILEGRSIDSTFDNAWSSKHYLAGLLLALCGKTEPDSEYDRPANWAFSAVVGNLFVQDQLGIAHQREKGQIRRILQSFQAVRQPYFCAVADLVHEMKDPKDELGWLYSVSRFAMFNEFGAPADKHWLLKLLQPLSHYKYRVLAFDRLKCMLQPGESKQLADAMIQAVSDYPEWVDIIKRGGEPQAELQQVFGSEFFEEERAVKARLKAEKEQWLSWRSLVMANPSIYLSEPNLMNSVTTICDVLYSRVIQSRADLQWEPWDSEFIKDSFSAEFLCELRLSLQNVWRTMDNALLEKRYFLNEHDALSGFQISLISLQCDAEAPLWADTVSAEQANRALSLLLRSKLLPVAAFAKLESAYPKLTRNSVCSELHRQLIEMSAIQPVSIDQLIKKCGSAKLKEQASTVIIDFLQANAAKYKIKEFGSTFRNLLDIVVSFASAQDKGRALEVCKNAFAPSSSESGPFWLRATADLDFSVSCTLLIEATAPRTALYNADQFIRLSEAVLPMNYGNPDERFEGLSSEERLLLLDQLLSRIWEVQLRTDSQSEKFSFVTTTLLQSLAATKSLGAVAVLARLKKLPYLKEKRGLLEKKTTEIAELLAQPAPMSARDTRKLMDTKQYQAHDSVSLSTLMQNRLNDWEHDIRHSEFSIINTIRSVQSEIEHRRLLAFHLHHTSRGIYTINQEAVSHNEKRTDIRIQPNTMTAYASIELKIDDSSRRWSGKELQNSLINQLVGQYMQHNVCKVGCLLICMRKTRRWTHPQTKRKMNLAQTVAWLQGIADNLVAKQPELYLWVKGIDLT